VDGTSFTVHLGRLIEYRPPQAEAAGAIDGSRTVLTSTTISPALQTLRGRVPGRQGGGGAIGLLLRGQDGAVAAPRFGAPRAAGTGTDREARAAELIAQMDAFSGGAAEHVIASRRRDELPRLVAGFGRLLAGAGPEPAEWSRCLPNRRAQAGRVAGVRGGNEPGGPGDAGGALPRCVLRSEAGTRAKHGNRCARTWRSPWIFGPDAGKQRHTVKMQLTGGHRWGWWRRRPRPCWALATQ